MLEHYLYELNWLDKYDALVLREPKAYPLLLNMNNMKICFPKYSAHKEWLQKFDKSFLEEVYKTKPD